MDVDAHRVAQAVAEAPLIAVAVDVVAGDGVDLAAGPAGGHRVLRHLLGVQHDPVDLLHFSRGLAKGDGAGHVGAVIAVARAKVHGNHVPAAQAVFAGHRVRQRAVGPGGHDRGKRRLAGPVAHHVKIEPEGELLFGHTFLDVGQDALERLARDAAGLTDEGQLVRILDLAQAGDLPAHHLPFHPAHALAQGVEGVDGHKVVLIVQGVDPAAGAQRAGDVLVRGALFGHQHLKAGSLRLRLLGIAKVRHDGADPARDQHQALARVAGEIEHIAGVIDHHALVIAKVHGIKEPFYTFCQCRSLTYGRFGT